jgi:hypothetical protein
MTLLYPKPEETTYKIKVEMLGNSNLHLSFSADCGKFGTEEQLDEYFLTVKQLLYILQENEDENP